LYSTVVYKESTIFIKYIKKLFTKWILLLGLLPTAYDYLSVYFKIEIELPIILKLIFIVIIFIIASYSVWNEENKLNMKLQEKLQNPIDYKITAVFKEIEFLFDDYMLESEEFCNTIDNKLIKIDNILSKENNDNLNLISYSLSALNHSNMHMSKSEDYYKKELLEYKNELIKFKENIKIINNNMKKNIINEISKIYSVSFIIENIGIKSDSDINIKILSNNKFLNKYKIDDMIYKHQVNYPIEPEPPKSIELFSVSRNNLFEHDLHHLHNLHNPNAYRQNESIEENKIFTILRDMNVGDEVLVIKSVLYIMKEDSFNMNYIIKSKESTKVIEKEIEIHFDNQKLIYNKTE